MKYFLYIFTYLLLGASCSSPSRPIDYGTELTATDSICLSIDEHTHYESKSIFQFEENGHEYLSFLNEKFTQEDAPSKYQHLSPSPGGP